jgi:putative transposase
VKGRKRHLLVDTLGLVLCVIVHAASVQDRDGARRVFLRAGALFPDLRRVWADGGYEGKLVSWVKVCFDWTLDIVKRPVSQKGFSVLPRRWIVERTFAWLGRYRRLSKDYEQLPQSGENMIYIAMINLMLHRLEPEKATR